MMAGRAAAGEVRKTGCPHPMSAVGQFMDDMPGVDRSGRPTNLFECTICRNLLRLVDWNGNEAVDG
jgi:hypothetical protein